MDDELKDIRYRIATLESSGYSRSDLINLETALHGVRTELRSLRKEVAYLRADLQIGSDATVLDGNIGLEDVMSQAWEVLRSHRSMGGTEDVKFDIKYDKKETPTVTPWTSTGGPPMPFGRKFKTLPNRSGSGVAGSTSNEPPMLSAQISSTQGPARTSGPEASTPIAQQSGAANTQQSSLAASTQQSSPAANTQQSSPTDVSHPAKANKATSQQSSVAQGKMPSRFANFFQPKSLKNSQSPITTAVPPVSQSPAPASYAPAVSQSPVPAVSQSLGQAASQASVPTVSQSPDQHVAGDSGLAEAGHLDVSNTAPPDGSVQQTSVGNPGQNTGGGQPMRTEGVQAQPSQPVESVPSPIGAGPSNSAALNVAGSGPSTVASDNLSKSNANMSGSGAWQWPRKGSISSRLWREPRKNSAESDWEVQTDGGGSSGGRDADA